MVCDLAFSLMKPFWAKTSDIYGRGEMYPMALIFVIVGLVTAASAKSFAAMAAGTFIRVVGMTAVNSMNNTIVADLTTTRQRGFGISFQFWPYIILPWVSSYIVQSVVGTGGIGWAWGIGIDAIYYPIGVLVMTAIMLTFQRRAKKLESQVIVPKHKPSLYEICSTLDLGGLFILVVCLGFILVPIALASLQPHGYSTPWVIALLVLGPLGLLFVLPFYESRVAVHPFLPTRYLKHRAICLAFMLYFFDYMAAAASSQYLYNWALIAQGMVCTYMFLRAM